MVFTLPSREGEERREKKSTTTEREEGLGNDLRSDTLWAHALTDARSECRFWRVETGRFSVINRPLSNELISHIPVNEMQPMSHACVRWNYELIHPQSHEQPLTDTGRVFVLARRTTDTQEARCISTNHPKRWDSRQTTSHWQQRHVTVRTTPQTDHELWWTRVTQHATLQGCLFNDNVKPLRTHKHHPKRHIDKQSWIETLCFSCLTWMKPVFWMIVAAFDKAAPTSFFHTATTKWPRCGTKTFYNHQTLEAFYSALQFDALTSSSWLGQSPHLELWEKITSI